MAEQINGKTKIFSVIGNPIEHSLSPQIHNTIYKYMNLNYRYIPFQVEPQNLKTAVNGMRALGVKGFNVTIPYKEKIIPYLDEISEEAALIGAVNTVKNINGKLFGHTTDGEGFIKSINALNVDIKDKNILVIGAGGSSRSISVKMAMEGAGSIIILNRTVKKAQAICKIINNNIKNISGSNLLNQNKFDFYAKQSDIIINTTPIGMYPNNEGCPVNDFKHIKPGTVVCDLIYNPEMTQFLSKANELGCKTINGWGMLIYQALLAFEIWTDFIADDNLVNILYNSYSGWLGTDN